MDEKLLRELYKKYYKELYLYLYSLCKNRELSEDILQETFLKAILSLKDNHTNMRAWLYTVARNLYFNYSKKEKHKNDYNEIVLVVDENNELANTGIGKAYLTAGDYEKALYYLELGMAREYYSIDDILEEAAQRGETPLIVICDELADPHNLGAIIRSAECAGAHGVIIPKRRSVGLTATVAKSSAGAVEYMKVAKVNNINNAIAELKEKGVWIFGTAAEGSIPMYQADLTGPTAIVIGSEGDGMSRLVQKNCDVTVHIPMKGRITSLNASAAASILLYEAVRQRIG